MARTRVTVVGSYGIGNVGDVALLASAFRVLRQSFRAEDIAVVCPDLPYLRRAVPGATLLDPSGADVIRGDLVVYGGGTQFFAFSKARLFQRVVRAATSPLSMGRRLLRKAARQRWRFERAACLGIGIGPFVAGAAEELRTRELFRTMGFVAVRDQESLRLCERWGVHHATLRSDLCFADQTLAGALSPRKETRKPGAVAAVVRDWPHSAEGAAYIEPLLETADRLTRRGKPVTFFSFCPGDDEPLNRRLRRDGYEVVAWDPERDDIAAFVQQLAEYRIIVTARYHGAIFAALMGRACICVEVEQKLRLAAETLDVARYLWRQPFSSDALYELVNVLEAESSEASARVGAAVVQQRALAETMLSEFASFIRQGAGTRGRSRP